MVPKFPNLMKTKNSEIHAAQQISHREHEENYTKTQHNQLLKINDKKEILKSEREKKKRYTQEQSVSDFSQEIMQRRRKCSNIFRGLKDKITGNLEFFTLCVYLSDMKMN